MSFQSFIPTFFRTSLILAITAMSLAASLASAATPKSKTENLIYKFGPGVYEGLITRPKAGKGKLPAVLLIHNWMGVTDETKKQAERIADLGFVALSADIYGQDVRPKNPQEAGAVATKYKSDRSLFRERLNLALKTLLAQTDVDSSRVFAVGYCFGGTGVIELARSGAAIKGVVSFHGGLDSPASALGAKIKTKILALHGADDPFVSPEDLAAFEKEMRDHKVDWQLIKFGGAVHSFTDVGAGNDNTKGAAYNAAADARSFQAFKDFVSL